MEKVLLSMGYRKLSGYSTYWAKPVGYQQLIFCTDNLKLVNLFAMYSCPSETIVYNLEMYNNDCDFKEWLQQTEQMTRLDLTAGRGDFSFLTVEQIIGQL